MSHWSESIFLCVVHWWCWSVEFLIFVAMAIINQEFLVVAAVVVVFNSPDLIGVIASVLSWDCGLLSFLARLFMGNVARLTCNWRNKCFTLGNISATERRWVHILYCLALFPKRSLIARISVNLITLLYAFESRFLVCQHHVGRTFFQILFDERSYLCCTQLYSCSSSKNCDHKWLRGKKLPSIIFYQQMDFIGSAGITWQRIVAYPWQGKIFV